MSSHIFFDGKVIPFEEARVSPDDLGILRGFAVYEGITSFNGVPFHFHDHWVRLLNSASALSLTVPLTEEEAYQGAVDVTAKNAGTERANLRVILSGGPAESGIEYVPSRSLFYIMAEKAFPLPANLYTDGASLITHEHERFMPEFKTTTYITAVNLQKARKDAGAIEILYTSGDRVLECATSNICIVKNGVVITPSQGVLKGITRAVVLELAKGIVTAEERPLTVSELYDADEIFITSSFKDIVPIVKIDGKEVAGGVVGPITKELMQMFKKSTDSQV